MTSSLRPLSSTSHSRILGVGVYRPARVVTNEEICQRIDSTDEWILTRSGISTRRWAAPDESVLDMAVTASAKAMAQSGISPEEVDCVVVATSTFPENTPPAAPQLAHHLGIENPAAFDVTAGCAGFCYGVALASDIVKGGSARYVLVVGADKLSDFTDHDDRANAFLFGDGAGAVLVGPSDTPGIGPVVWGSDGSHANLIRQTATPYDMREDPERWPFIKMQGPEVFRWASYQMVPVARQALEKAGVSIEELNAFIPHQANLRITEAMSRALKLPQEVPVARDIVDMGNTSAASIPLAMERMLASGEVASGGTALLVGFGAGLVYAAQVVILP